MPDQKRRKNFLYPRPKEGTDPTEQREFPYLPEAVNASFVIGGADAEAVPVKEGTPIPAPEPEPAEPPGRPGRRSGPNPVKSPLSELQTGI